MGTYVDMVFSPSEPGYVPENRVLRSGFQELSRREIITFQKTREFEIPPVPAFGERMKAWAARLRGKYQPPAPVVQRHTQRAYFLPDPTTTDAVLKHQKPINSPADVDSALVKIAATNLIHWEFSFPVHESCPVASAIPGNEFFSGIEIFRAPGYSIPACSIEDVVSGVWTCGECREVFDLFDAVGEELRCPKCEVPFQLPPAEPPINDLSNERWPFTPYPHAYRFCIRFCEYKLDPIETDQTDPVFTRDWRRVAEIFSEAFKTLFVVHPEIW